MACDPRRTTCAPSSRPFARRLSPRHLEIETYTWDVLPAALKIDLVESIAREYDWVLKSFAPTDTSSG